MLKILIADDEPKIRRGLRKLIESFEIPSVMIEEASNGLEALEVAKTFLPNLLTIDINMPLLNGLELTQGIKKILPESIILIVTGYDQFDYARKALRLRVDDYLVKPIDEELLLQYILEASNKITQEDNQEGITCIVKRVKEYIDDHYAESDLTLEAVADQFKVSVSYISRLMKREMGMSFVDYLTKVRIESACELLTKSEIGVKIYEVAEKVGYNSQHYFSRVFKKNKGVTPIDYKRDTKDKTIEYYD